MRLEDHWGGRTPLSIPLCKAVGFEAFQRRTGQGYLGEAGARLPVKKLCRRHGIGASSGELCGASGPYHLESSSGNDPFLRPRPFSQPDAYERLMVLTTKHCPSTGCAAPCATIPTTSAVSRFPVPYLYKALLVA